MLLTMLGYGFSAIPSVGWKLRLYVEPKLGRSGEGRSPAIFSPKLILRNKVINNFLTYARTRCVDLCLATSHTTNKFKVKV